MRMPPGRPVPRIEVVVAVLDRPRHEGLIDEIRSAGAGTRLLLDGDVAGGINAARYETRIDMCVGIGGSPEAVVTACAIKALGGLIEARLAPKDEAERQRGIAAGLDLERIYDADGLVSGNNTMFVATGVTDGSLLPGVRRSPESVTVETVLMRSKTGSVRRMTYTNPRSAMR